MVKGEGRDEVNSTVIRLNKVEECGMSFCARYCIL